MTDATALTTTTKYLAANLRALRRERGLTQVDLAAAAGITGNHYQLLEAGRSPSGGPANPRLGTLLALAAVHRVLVTDLLTPPPTH